MTENHKNHSGKTTEAAFLLFAVVFIAVAGVSFIRMYGMKHFLSTPALTLDVNRNAADLFLKNLKAGDAERSILYAKSLASDTLSEAPRGDYMIFAQDLGVENSFLTDPFNKTDFLYWKDLLAVKDIADSIAVEKDKSVPEGIFSFLKSKIKIDDKAQVQVKIAEILKGESPVSGLDAVRAAAALLRQKGFTPYLLIFPGLTWKKIPPLMEVWKDGKLQGTGIVWSGEYVAGASAENLIKKLFPDEKTDKVHCLQITELPALRIFNTKLGDALIASGISGVPLLSFDPNADITAYPKSDNLAINYWNDSAKLFPLLPECEKYRLKPKDEVKK